MSPPAPVSEIELSGASTLRFFKGCGLLGTLGFAFMGLLAFTSWFSHLPEPGSFQGGLGVALLVVAAFNFYSVAPLTQAVATPAGLRVRGGLIPWSEVDRFVVAYNGFTTVDHTGGVLRTLYRFPWPPGVPDHLDQVVSWWREHAEVEERWRPIGSSFAAVR